MRIVIEFKQFGMHFEPNDDMANRKELFELIQRDLDTHIHGSDGYALDTENIKVTFHEEV